MYITQCLIVSRYLRVTLLAALAMFTARSGAAQDPVFRTLYIQGRN